MVFPPENTVNGLGYELLSVKQHARAAKHFKMNVDNYPESHNVFVCYGEYFLAIEDNSNAIKYFKEALP